MKQLALIIALFATSAAAQHPVVDCMPLPLPERLAPMFDDFTLFYNESNAPRMTQYRSRVVPANKRFNSNVNFLRDGRRADTSGNNEWPWGPVGGGMHEIPDGEALVEKTYWHPERKPVRWYKSKRAIGFGVWRDESGRIVSNLPTVDAMDCRFPVDAVMGEILTMRWRAHAYTCEVRTLVAEPDAWQDFSYRRWNTRDDLVKLIEEQGYLEVAEQLAALPREARQVVDRMHNRQVISLSFYEVDIPELPEDLVDKLWQNVPLREVTEASDLYSEAGQILPPRYHPAHVGIGPESCIVCHKFPGTHVMFADPAREWYPDFGGTGRAKSGFAIYSFPFLQPGNEAPLEPNRRLVQSGHLAPFNGESGYQ